jgi:dipeptidyl aminopeptidase/acylaminoacyl peptidase
MGRSIKFITATLITSISLVGYANSSDTTNQNITEVIVTAKNNAYPPVEAFARLPAKSNVVISPLAKHLAWIENNSVVTYDMETGKQYTLSGGSNKPIGLRWASEEKLIVGISTQAEFQSLLTINFNTFLVLDNKANYIGPLFESKVKGKPSFSGPILKIVQGENPYALIIGQDGETSGRLSSGNGDENVAVIYKVDIETLKKTIYERGKSDTSDWSLDRNYIPRVRTAYLNGKINYGASRVKVEVRRTPNQPYELVKLEEKKDILYSDFTYSESDNGMFWNELNTVKNITDVYFYDFATGKTSLHKSVEGEDFSLVYNQKDNRRVGETDYKGRSTYNWTDKQYSNDYGTLKKAFPDMDISIISRSDDENLMIAQVTREKLAAVYYLYDRSSKTLELVGESYPELNGANLGTTTFTHYTASDGLKIPVYITKRNDIKTPAPTIFVVHGGPAANDRFGFDWWPQFLANRGYIVVQPQYRGSTGFGKEFQKAGDKQWGRKMNSDLVDGIDFLVKEGLTDPEKVCVNGWSYGGYATMAAVTLTPDKWRCGIQGAGVSDPIRMINWVYKDRELGSTDSGGQSGTNYWKSVIGDPRTENASIKEISPLLHVDKMKAPLLLFHGDKDIIVPKEQSEIMWEAMKKSNKKGKLIILPNETHNIILYESRYVFLKEMESFLKEHNPSELNK